MDSISPSDPMIYEFEMPQEIVGRLIGRFGNFVNKIKVNTGANIIVKVHHTSTSMKICAIEGSSTAIEDALSMIRDRFPSTLFPYLSFEQVNCNNQLPATASISYLPSNNKLSLIEGVINDISVTNVVTLDHIFVQQPTHPTFTALARMHKILSTVYEQDGVPQLVRPFNPGVICVTRIGKDEWVRAEVVALQEEKDEVTARLIDVGGYVQVSIDDLRQIRVDFVSIPFQATECRLANLIPIDETVGWTEEALTFFKLLTQGQLLQAYVVAYSPGDCTTLIHLYRPNADQTFTLINEEMVSHGYAKWVEETECYYVSSSVDGTESGEEVWSSHTPELGGNDYSSVELNDNDHSSIEGIDQLSEGNDVSSIEGIIDNLSSEGNNCSEDSESVVIVVVDVDCPSSQSSLITADRKTIPSVDSNICVDGMRSLSIRCTDFSSSKNGRCHSTNETTNLSSSDV